MTMHAHRPKDAGETLESVLDQIRDNLGQLSRHDQLQHPVSVADVQEIYAAAEHLSELILATANSAAMERSELVSAQSSSSNDDEKAVDRSSRTGVSILLVEDNTVNRMVAEGMLRQFHCDIDVAENGVEAVRQFNESKYDLVFMDCQMPVMDGFEAVAEIRDIESDQRLNRTPVVALTANALKGDRDRCISAGMDDYVSKPFSLNDLCDVLERQLDGDKTAQFKCISDGGMRQTVKPAEVATNESSQSNEKLIDLSVLNGIKSLTKTDGNELLCRIISVFLKTTPRLVKNLQAALEDGDHESITVSAHALRSCCSSVGAVGLSKLCQTIEDRARSGDVEGMGKLRNQVGRVFDSLTLELQQIVSGGQE